MADFERHPRDRDCPPCPRCGAAIYEKYWGNGGWAPTDASSCRTHAESDCIRVLKAERDQLARKLAVATMAMLAAKNEVGSPLRAVRILARLDGDSKPLTGEELAAKHGFKPHSASGASQVKPGQTEYPEDEDSKPEEEAK